MLGTFYDVINNIILISFFTILDTVNRYLTKRIDLPPRSCNTFKLEYCHFSNMGADGITKLRLTAKESYDDIIRANNGTFVGLGADY